MFFRGQIIGKYKILSTIGSGGFGTVYLSEDTWIDKKVALKVPHKQNLDFGDLLREPRLLATLNHPNIVTILTAEKQENIFFIVMEFVPGETLESIVARKGALDLSLALDYTCQICNAVDHAHRHGVLHRDLRPSNVIVSDNGLLKVADFGTSRFLETLSDVDRSASVCSALTRGSRSAQARGAADGAAAEEPEDPEDDQRHRAQSDGARHSRTVPARQRAPRRSARSA